MNSLFEDQSVGQDKPDLPGRTNSDELMVLLEEYKQLSAQATSRYQLRYQFHALVLLVVGTMATLHAGDSARNWVLLVGPPILVSLMLLMLKQHAYVDLRSTYIRLVLRPRIVALLTRGGESPLHMPLHILGWTTYEQSLLRGKKRSAKWLQIYSPVEYVLPFLASVVCIGVFVSVKDTAWSGLELFGIAFDVVFVMALPIFMYLSRNKTPHLDPTSIL